MKIISYLLLLSIFASSLNAWGWRRKKKQNKKDDVITEIMNQEVADPISTEGMTDFAKAAYSGNLEEIISFINDKTKNPNEVSGVKGYTPLLYSILKNNTYISVLLLPSSNLNFIARDGETALTLAKKYSVILLEDLKKEIDNQAIIDDSSRKISKDDMSKDKEVDLEFAKKLSSISSGEELSNILLQEVTDKNSNRVAEILDTKKIDKGLDNSIFSKDSVKVNFVNKDNQPLLLIAVNNMDYKTVEMLFNSGANREIWTSDGKSLIEVAVEKGDLDVITVFLNKGFDPVQIRNIASRLGNSSIMSHAAKFLYKDSPWLKN